MQMDGDESSNIEDRRGMGGGGGPFGGGLGGMGGGYGGGGFGPGIPIPIGGGLFKGGFGILAFIVLALIMSGGDLGSILGGGSGTSSGPALQPPPARTGQAPRSDAETQFVSRVLRSTEIVWADQFGKIGRQYREPRLVLFEGATNTACGMGQSAMGPFYCPPDQRVYLDLAFFDEMATRFRAPGQFPQAYVISHEIGHHVQTLLGTSSKVQQMRQSMSKRDGNALSVRTELQADCYAGIWAYYANRERGGTATITDQDIEQAMAAAAAIGDDRLQRQSQGRVVPDSFTHGTSAQRMRWFKVGLESGDMRRCDTFNVGQI
jgi:predicted metalloprotease